MKSAGVLQPCLLLEVAASGGSKKAGRFIFIVPTLNRLQLLCCLCPQQAADCHGFRLKGVLAPVSSTRRAVGCKGSLGRGPRVVEKQAGPAAWRG